MLKYSKRIGLKATVLAAALAALPLSTLAAGLGRITVHSALGQPLKAELEITATRDELPSVSVGLAGGDAFRQAGIEYVPALTSLRFAREVKERNGRRYVEISTDRPLNEPFIDMLLVLKWASGTLVREYTFLLDPPELAKPQAMPVTAPEVKAEPVPAKPASATQDAPVEAKKPAGVRIPAMASSSAQAASAASERKVGAGGTERTVKSGDTLGKIAAETRADGVSLDQMLVALFRSNRDAFDGGNMNRLKAGKILSVPDAEAAKAIDAKEARKEIVAQSADFNAYRKKLASGVADQPARADDAKRAVAGKIAPKVEDKAPAVPAGKDKLEVSRTEAGKAGGKMAVEDKVAKERALKEANSRISELEKNLADMKRLAELKSQHGADLQKQAQAGKAPPPVADKKPEPAPVAKPAEATKPADPAKPAAPAPGAPAKPGEPAVKPAEPSKAEVKPAEGPKPADPAKPADPPKPADAPKPPPKKPAPPPPEPEPDFLEENGPLVFGGAGVIALLLGYLGFAAYRKKKAAAQNEVSDAVTNSAYTTSSVFATTGGQTVDTSAAAETNFSMQDTTATTAPENVDPVVEADTYLAFGRDAQAEEILMEALKQEPSRHAIHVKLLEIYAARKAKPQFQTLAEDLKSQTGGQGAEWERAATMGIALDPANPLYQAVTVAAVTAAAAEPTDFSATVVVSPQDKTAMMAAAEVVETPPPAPAPAPEEVATLDFDLDLGAPADTPAETNDAVEAPAAADDVVALDFDLDLGKPAAEPAAPATATVDPGAGLTFDIDLGKSEASASEPTLGTAAAPEASAGGLDIEFDVGTPALSVPEISKAEPPVSGNSVDFNFDLPAPTVADASADEAVSAPPPLDLGGISLELDTPAAPALSLDMPLDVAPAAEGAAPVAADNPEVTTKLELAQAYQEMGDRDGARELYEEAMREGSPGQQELARGKLAELG